MSTLEARIRLEVGRVITNANNFPEPMRAHMLGRDLAEPIELITKALLPVIAEAQAEAYEKGHLDGDLYQYFDGMYPRKPNPYRSNDE